MTASPEQVQIEAATAYESLFVPALFDQWCGKVADAARIQPGQRVLDVACGTGVLARYVARRIGASGAVTGLDANPGMLEVARRNAPAIRWLSGRAESLPLEDGSFDAVVCQFGLMFFGDPARAVREMLRVLTPRGHLAVAVWDALENNPLYAAEVDLLAQVAGQAAADALRAPFALGERHLLKKVFDDAGAGAIDIATLPGKAQFPSISVVLEADMRGWLPMVGVPLSESTIERVLAAADPALARYVSPAENGVEFDLSAHVVSATRSGPTTNVSC